MFSRGFAKLLEHLFYWASPLAASGFLLQVLQVYLHQRTNLNKSFYKFCKFIYKSFLVRGHSLITHAKKSKFLMRLPYEYATAHFGTYRPSLPINTYTKWFIVHLYLLSLEVRLVKRLELSHITLVNNVSRT